MVQVKTIEEFVEKNHKELIKSIHYLHKSLSKEDVEEISQNFYLCIIKIKALEKYNPNSGACFSTYIWRALKWMIADHLNMKTKHNRPIGEEVGIQSFYSGENDKYSTSASIEAVWSNLGEFDGKYKISPLFTNSFSNTERSTEILKNIEEFKGYLMSLKEKEKKKSNMVKYIEFVDFGLKGIDIAKKFSVSNTMVKNIRKDVQKYFVEWKKNRNSNILSEFCL